MEEINKENISNEENEIFDFKSIMNSGIEKCVCKIIREIENNGELKYKTGTGFFCNIQTKKLKVFITNNHLIDKEFLDKENKLIYITEKDGKDIKNELNLLNRFKYTDETFDFTVIEILQEDNIYNFLEIDQNINSKDFKDEQILTVQFPDDGKLKYSKGKNLDKKNNLFLYTIGTKGGSSGSPIILLDNFKLIGLHKGAYDNKKKDKINLGVPMNIIIHKINFIKCIYNIGIENIGQEVQLINNGYYSNDKFIKKNDEIEKKIKIIKNGKILGLKHKFYQKGKNKNRRIIIKHELYV
jgi:V8-like Glu-specific endopeptidase